MQERQPAALLFVRTIGQNRVHHQGTLNRDKTAEAGINTLQFLHDEAVLHIAHPGTAVAFEVGTQKAQFRHLGDEFCGETAIPETIANQGRGTLVRETPRGAANQQFLFGKLGIKQQIVNAHEIHIGSAQWLSRF